MLGHQLQLKGISTFSDDSGNFSLEEIESGSVIVISYVGYQTQEITYTNQTNLKVQLVADMADLDEIVVVAYGLFASGFQSSCPKVLSLVKAHK